MRSSPHVAESPSRNRPAAGIDDAQFSARLARIPKAHPGKRVLYRLLLLLAFVPAALAFGVGLLRDSDPADQNQIPQRVDFAQVQRRFAQVGWRGQTHKEVEQLLGLPTERFVIDPELEEVARHVGGGGDSRPKIGAWDRWVDSQNAKRWVAVYYDRGTIAGIVYFRYKKGF